MVTYNLTEEQITEICRKASDVMKPFTDVQNCTFPTSAIRKGLKEGLTVEQIGDLAYDSVAGLPLCQTGFGLVGTGDSMHNIASYMRGTVIDTLNGILASIE